MAGDTEVEVPDEGIVTIDVAGDPGDPTTKAPVETGEKGSQKTDTEVVVATKEKEPRKRKAQESEAAEALNNAIKVAEEERENQRKRAEAAEATAAAERAKAVEAQRVAEQHAEEAKGYREQAEQGEIAAINAAIDGANKRVASAKLEYRRAKEAAEFDKESDAAEEMADAKADLKLAMQRKAELENGAVRQKAHEGRVEAPQRQNTSAFEQYVGNMSPRSQSWLRAHPDCAPGAVGGNQTKNDKMMAGHYAAKAKGYAPDTEEYFNEIELSLGLRQPATVPAPTSVASDVEPAGERRTRPAPAPAAPPSREPPSASGQPAPRTSQTVRLSAQQQEAAQISFPQNRGEDEQAWKRRAYASYAYNLVQLESEGRLGRTSH